MNGLLLSLAILGLISMIFLIIGILYFIISQRRRSIVLKKVDYLVEDITYKSETLSSTVNTVAKIANYVDVFEVFTQKNIKSLTRVISRNKDDIYKILDRVKKMAMGQSKEEENKNSKSKGGR